MGEFLKVIEKFVHDASDWFEIGGFLISVIMAFKLFFINRRVKELQNSHLLAVRINDHLKELSQASEIMSAHLASFSTDIDTLKLISVRCIEHCVSLTRKDSRKQLQNLKPLISNMRKVQKLPLSRGGFLWGWKLMNPVLSQEHVQEAYITLNALIEEIKQYNKDRKSQIHE